jgi:beta-lactamase class A
MSNKFTEYVKSLTDEQLQQRNLLARFEYSELENQGKMTQEQADKTILFLQTINAELRQRELMGKFRRLN